MTESNWEVVPNEEEQKENSITSDEFIKIMRAGSEQIKEMSHYEAPDPARIAQENREQFVSFIESITNEVAALMENSGIFSNLELPATKILLPLKFYVQNELEARKQVEDVFTDLFQEIMNFIYNIEKLLHENNELRQAEFFATARRDVHTISLKIEACKKSLVSE
jgi:hypothetical protein